MGQGSLSSVVAACKNSTYMNRIMTFLCRGQTTMRVARLVENRTVGVRPHKRAIFGRDVSGRIELVHDPLCRRYAAGETPTERKNQLQRWLCEEKPEERATSTIGESVLRKRSLARSIRRASTY